MNKDIRLFDRQWVNVVTHGNCYEGYTKEEVAAAVGLPASKRPTDNQIIFAVAAQFNVDFHTALQWITELQMEKAA